jgi:Polyketide cyclase / dehydrase and lipid transport
MTKRPHDRILVERVFDVGLPADRVWALLAQVERWPEWAPHIRRARVVGGGPLGPESKGDLRFWPAGSGSVHMTTWEPHHLWTWRGRVVGLPVVYQHYFEALPGPTTRLRWVVELAEGRRGPRANAFALVYARIVDRAWPRFVAWAQQQTRRQHDNHPRADVARSAEQHDDDRDDSPPDD